MVLARGVGHATPVAQVDDVNLDLVGVHERIRSVDLFDSLFAAVALGYPALEELELLAVVVNGPLAPAAGALGVQEEVDRVPQVQAVRARLPVDRPRRTPRPRTPHPCPPSRHRLL